MRHYFMRGQREFLANAKRDINGIIAILDVMLGSFVVERGL